MGWLQRRRERKSVTDRALERLRDVETAFPTFQRELEAALSAFREQRDGYKAVQRLLLNVESLERRFEQLHEDTKTGLAAAHETARTAVNSVKGQKGGRGHRNEAAEIGEEYQALVQTTEGRKRLIDHLESLNGDGSVGSPLVGDARVYRG